MKLSSRITICAEVAVGMRHLEREGFVHRDLACRNILLDDDMCAKVADFGMARCVQEGIYEVAVPARPLVSCSCCMHCCHIVACIVVGLPLRWYCCIHCCCNVSVLVLLHVLRQTLAKVLAEQRHV